MKIAFSKVQMALVAGLALGLVDCSKTSGGSSSSGAASCASGTVSTSAGCLQTCGTSNGVNLVVYNNQCVLASSVTGTTYGQSCGTNMITSQYGCLASCGTMSVMYNGSCVAVTSSTSAGSNICSAGCGTGQVMTAMGCMPTSPACGTCYGFNNGACYIGNYAHQYYGY